MLTSARARPSAATVPCRLPSRRKAGPLPVARTGPCHPVPLLPGRNRPMPGGRALVQSPVRWRVPTSRSAHCF
eukprot:7015698-Prymnesium_polylepis.1